MNADVSAVSIVMPAEGPSFGVAWGYSALSELSLQLLAGEPNIRQFDGYGLLQECTHQLPGGERQAQAEPHNIGGRG